jgi:hypothetical protein
MSESPNYLRMILDEGIRNRQPVAVASRTHDLAVLVSFEAREAWFVDGREVLPDSEPMHLLEGAYDQLRFATDFLSSESVSAQERLSTAVWSVKQARFSLVRAFGVTPLARQLELMASIDDLLRRLEE